MVKVSDDFTLMIDYAHNAMALESLLTTLKEYHPHRLVCLFGCGGNRSKLRRYEMGEVSGKLADLTIITSDNPRDEEPQAIIDDIKIGMAKTDGKYVEIPDRKEAIAYAIHHGEPGDIIVLAGDVYKRQVCQAHPRQRGYPWKKAPEQCLSLIHISMCIRDRFKVIPFLSEVSSGFVIIITTLIVAGAAAYFCPIEDEKEEEGVHES